MSEPYSLETLQTLVGQELGVSDWMTIDQTMIDRFAEITLDDQWIHIDVERAARESPFGGTVAHGFLTLSLLPYLRRGIPLIPAGVKQVVNYGADYLRFVRPVKAGARVRLRTVLSAVEPRGEGRWLIKSHNTIEIEGESAPAVVADTLALVYTDSSSP